MKKVEKKKERIGGYKPPQIEQKNWKKKKEKKIIWKERIWGLG